METVGGTSLVATIVRPTLPELPPEIRSKRIGSVEKPSAPLAMPVAVPIPPPVELVEEIEHVKPVEAPAAPVEPRAKTSRKRQKPFKKLGPVQKKRGMSRGIKRALVSVAAIGATILISGYVYLNVLAGNTLVTSLQEGQCVTEFFGESEQEFDEIFDVKTSECVNPHAYEVYAAAATVYPDSDYPGVEEAFRLGQAFCMSEYDEFVGGVYATSPWDVWTFVPTSQRWTAGDRVVQCLVGDFNQTSLTVGTLKGAGSS
jgi:hypothetical protein